MLDESKFLCSKSEIDQTGKEAKVLIMKETWWNYSRSSTPYVDRRRSTKEIF